MECASCAARIDHCHGTLVVHPEGGFAECTDPACVDADRVRHALIVDCPALGGCGCAAAAPEKSLLRHAS
ncbi:hypothetical protein H4696_001310 [Amycolatopsis lexingtonensis]|uniref:Uncharacterized protein n=1 Tax=Amycolatopsis lexingtonensis TaxID=218822 RepID=A0ABR9HTF9_9PSEU|nr:hypothetical protein [Amycolatopsis lexingtonensis]MBE1494210.1 hypothetical protein [Amycolatopsis lexingtonensis]